MRERTETEVNPASQHSVPELFRAIRARRVVTLARGHRV